MLEVSGIRGQPGKPGTNKHPRSGLNDLLSRDWNASKNRHGRARQINEIRMINAQNIYLFLITGTFSYPHSMAFTTQ
jgi:hypothetical protein